MAYSEYPKDEAAKWALEVDEATRKFRQSMRGALSQAASAGFDEVPGSAMADITEAAVVAKIALTQANGKIYGGGLQVVEKAVDVDQKVAFGFAKLDMESYREQIENAHAVEKAEADYSVEEQRARVERIKSDVERGQIAIIEERAQIEAEIDAWRLVGIAAEDDALDAEVDLANERVRTAQSRLAIIDHLYAVIEAENLVLGAERRKAAAMQRLIAAETLVVEAKRGLIPLQREKATVRLKEADAVRQEADVKRDIELLGYDKLAVKRAQDDAEHQIRLAEVSFEEARLLVTRTERQTDLLRAQLRTALMDYQNLVREQVMSEKASLDQQEKLFRLDYQHVMQKFNITGDARHLDTLRAMALYEANQRIGHIRSSTMSKSRSILETQERRVVRSSGHQDILYISEEE